MEKILLNKNNKNLFLGKNGLNISLTIDKEIKEVISLKSLIKNSLSGAISTQSLNIQVIIAQNIHVDLNDDLMDFDITKSRVEFVLNKNSSLNYDLKIKKMDYFLNSNYSSVIGFFNNEPIQKELDFKFIGEHSSAKISCVCKGETNQVFKFKTIQDHQAANTKSDLLIKGALCKQSKIISDNIIRVDKNAKNVQAQQLNKNLLLGCNARAISIPKLEVKADAVKCKHGATVSKLDENQLFYLQCRGFDYCSAKNLLLDAFLN